MKALILSHLTSPTTWAGVVFGAAILVACFTNILTPAQKQQVVLGLVGTAITALGVLAKDHGKTGK